MTNQCNAIKPDYTTETTEKGVILNIELPGVLKQNTSITSEANTLTVTAKRDNAIPEEWQVINQARLTEEYALELELSQDFNLADTKANFKNGILRLEIAKHEAVLPRKIDILD